MSCHDSFSHLCGKIWIMSIDERIIALQSSIAELHEAAVIQGVKIKSLHSSATELHAIVESRGETAELRASTVELRAGTTELSAAAVQDQTSIRALADSIAALARKEEASMAALKSAKIGGSISLH